MTARTFLGLCSLLIPGVISAQSPSKLADAHYQLGESLSEAGDFDQAIMHFDSSIVLNPYHFEAYYGRAIIHEKKQDFQHALNDYNAMLSLDSTHTEAYWGRGRLLFKLSNYDRAISDFEALLELPENETNAIFFKRRYPDNGISEISSLETMKAQIFGYLAQCHTELNEYDEALYNLDQAINLDSLNSDLWVNRSRLNEKSGKVSMAISDLQRAVLLDGSNDLARYNMARLQAANSRDAELVNTYTQIIENNPQFSEAYAQRGLAKMRSGDLSGALVDYDSAILFDPKDELLWLNRGIIHMNLGYLDHAIEDLNAAASLNPTNSDIWLNRGNVYMKQDQYELALKAYSTAVSFSPRFAHALYNRGIANYNLGNFSDACEDIRASNKLGFPGSHDTLKRMCDDQ